MRWWLGCVKGRVVGYNADMKLVEIRDRARWDEFVTGSDSGHPLQLWGWGETKRTGEWTPHRLILMDGEEWKAGAQVLTWPVPKINRVIAYVPRGPVARPGSEEAKR